MTQKSLVDAASATSEVRVESGNGLGSTNTVIRRYSTVVRNVGTAITYADSATLGASFTINEAGVYSISFVELPTATPYLGMSQNSNQLTTGVNSITNTHRIALIFSPSGNIPQGASVTIRAAIGDVLRVHHGAGATVGNGDALVYCHVTQIIKF